MNTGGGRALGICPSSPAFPRARREQAQRGRAICSSSRRLPLLVCPCTLFLALPAPPPPSMFHPQVFLPSCLSGSCRGSVRLWGGARLVLPANSPSAPQPWCTAREEWDPFLRAPGSRAVWLCISAAPESGNGLLEPAGRPALSPAELSGPLGLEASPPLLTVSGPLWSTQVCRGAREQKLKPSRWRLLPGPPLATVV